MPRQAASAWPPRPTASRSRRSPAPSSFATRRPPWESTEVHAPTVFTLPDGRIRMFYASGVSIGEAESIDGVHFTRVDPDPSTPAIEPVLGPAPPAPPGSLLPNEKPPFDTASVSDPCASIRFTSADRHQVRVLYTGGDAAGVTAIGFAGRFGRQRSARTSTEPGLLRGREGGRAGAARPRRHLVPLRAAESPDRRPPHVHRESRPRSRRGNIHLPEPLPFPINPEAPRRSAFVGPFFGATFSSAMLVGLILASSSSRRSCSRTCSSSAGPIASSPSRGG